MAYDLIRGVTTPGGWGSVGNDVVFSETTTGTFSLAKHAEMQSREKVVALAKLVESEVKNNASVAALRSRAGSMVQDDAQRWKRFEAGWYSWKAKNINGVKPTSPQTIADLEQWRFENTEWTRRLTTAVSPSPSQTPGLTSPSPQPGTTLAKASSSAPVTIGLVGLLLLLLGLGRK